MHLTQKDCMELCSPIMEIVQYQWSWKNSQSKGVFSVAIFPSFPCLKKGKVAVEGNSYGAIQCLKNTTGPTRQCSSYSVNALVQWRVSVEIMLLVSQHRKNIDKIITALTALVLWRNNYCLRTKMYIVAHDISVDKFFFFKLLYFIWY